MRQTPKGIQRRRKDKAYLIIRQRLKILVVGHDGLWKREKALV